jgi:hypothetical protein
MPTGIFIPADDSVELTIGEFSSLQDYQMSVGGYIETLELVEPQFAISTLIINEEGKFLPAPPNKRATLLLWIHRPALRFRDEIVGDAILIGQADARGNITNVPLRMISLLLETSSYVIEMVRTNSDSTKRVQRTGPFKRWVNAYVVAADVAEVVADEASVFVVAA